MSDLRSLEPSMLDQAKPVSRPWRRYLLFSVRGLIVLVLLIGVGLGWMVRSAHIQRDAVAAIRLVGGSVIYDWARKTGNGMPAGLPRALRWLADLIGVDYFGHAIDVSIVRFSDTTAATIVEVGRLTELEQLSLVGLLTVSDADLAHLQSLANLTRLNLCETPVTDAGLAHLKGLKKVLELDLGSSPRH